MRLGRQLPLVETVPALVTYSRPNPGPPKTGQVMFVTGKDSVAAIPHRTPNWS